MNHSSDSGQVSDEIAGEVWRSEVSWRHGECENKEKRDEILNKSTELRNIFFLLSKPGIRRGSKNVHW